MRYFQLLRQCGTVSLLRGAAGGLSAVTPSEVPLTESPGEVLPMTQVDHPPPIISVQDVSLVRGVVSCGGPPYPGHGHSVRHAMTDQLRVGGVSYEPSLPPLAALSPTSFLFPSSDSGFVSLYKASPLLMLLSLILLSLLCLSAWLTRPLSRLLSLPSSVSSAVTSISPIFLRIFLRQISERCWLLLWFVPVLSLLSLMWLACWRTPRLLRRCALSRR